MTSSTSWREDAFNNDGPILAQWAKENEHEGRAYKDPATGKQYPSVTTVLKNTPKADMMRWAARVVAERARDRVDIVLGDPDKVVDRLQYAPTDYRDERGWVGSGVHKMVEGELLGIWFQPEDMTREQERMMDRFEEFLSQFEIEPILTECTILGDGYMGTLDGLWRVTDLLTGETYVCLMDLKTSKGLWPEHEYQLSALANATHWFEQVGGPEERSKHFPDAELEVHLHKHPKLGKTYWIRHEALPEFQQVRLLQLREEGYAWEPVADIAENYAIFRSYLGLWNNLKALKDKRKAIEFG